MCHQRLRKVGRGRGNINSDDFLQQMHLVDQVLLGKLLLWCEKVHELYKVRKVKTGYVF